MLKIAIIEDDQSIQDLYRIKLQIEGFNVVTAANGSEALVMLESELPDLALVDLRMPIMGGHEMLTHLRETKWGAAIRVVILTNISRAEAPSELRLLNIDRYVVKAHHTPSQIVDIVKEVLG